MEQTHEQQPLHTHKPPPKQKYLQLFTKNTSGPITHSAPIGPPKQNKTSQCTHQDLTPPPLFPFGRPCRCQARARRPNATRLRKNQASHSPSPPAGSERAADGSAADASTPRFRAFDAQPWRRATPVWLLGRAAPFLSRSSRPPRLSVRLLPPFRR